MVIGRAGVRKNFVNPQSWSRDKVTAWERLTNRTELKSGDPAPLHVDHRQCAPRRVEDWQLASMSISAPGTGRVPTSRSLHICRNCEFFERGSALNVSRIFESARSVKGSD
jgi:hypothetical protein